jgi:hypothetical protein
MGFYRLHAGGWWSSRSAVEKLSLVVSFFEELEGRLDERYAAKLRQHRDLAAASLRAEQARAAAVSLHADRGEHDATLGARVLETIDVAVPTDEVIAIATGGDAALLACSHRPALPFPPNPESDGSMVLLSADRAGQIQVPWIAEGATYDFELAEDGASALGTFAAISVARGCHYQEPRSPALPEGCLLRPEPNPVPSGPEWGETTISWATPEASGLQLFFRSRTLTPLLPDSDASAIEGVCALLGAGVRYLVFPQTTFAWIRSMSGLCDLLERSAEVVASSDDCRIYRFMKGAV